MTRRGGCTTGGALDDDAALLALARLALGGPRDEGRASYQIALTLCPGCERGFQPSGGELLPIGTDIVAMAHCDGQHLGSITLDAANDSAPPKSRDPSPSAHVGADLHAENDSRRHMDAGVHAPAQDRHAHVDADIPNENARAGAPVLARAQQSIPPALRRAILARDQRRCRVPASRISSFLDVHHIELRSEGGRNEADNLLTLCGAHHRATHRGQLLIEGASAPSARFRHADGSGYGQAGDPRALEAQARAFSALCGLGFREGDVRAAMGQLRSEGELVTATTEGWLRAALARLTPRRTRVE